MLKILLVTLMAAFGLSQAGAADPCDPSGSASKEETMLKTSLAAVLAVFTLSQASAADLCNDAHMKQMDDMIAKMTDTAKQKEATAALDQSKAAMKAGDNAKCMKYMDEAHKAMGL